jgi:hypothetical protein
MTTRSMLIVRQPRERLQAVLVERTWELAPLLDEISSVEVIAHDTERLEARSATHVWRAKASVPPLLAPHLDADHLSWTAVVRWNPHDFGSQWRIEPHALRESVSCSASVALEEAMGGRATRVVIEVGLDGLGARQGVETIAQRIVLVHWQKLVEAAARCLAAE